MTPAITRSVSSQSEEVATWWELARAGEELLAEAGRFYITRVPTTDLSSDNPRIITGVVYFGGTARPVGATVIEGDEAVHGKTQPNVGLLLDYQSPEPQQVSSTGIVWDSQLGRLSLSGISSPLSISQEPDTNPFESNLAVAAGYVKVQEPADLDLDLLAALGDVACINDQAREEGYPVPSALAIDNARSLVRTMFQMLPVRYDVYPSDDGEIVIDGGVAGRRIFVYCYANGDVLYIGWVDGERHHIRTSGDGYIATEFLTRALGQLGEHLAA